MFNRAEIYKNKIIETLQKPKLDSEYDKFSAIKRSYSPIENRSITELSAITIRGDIKEEPLIFDLEDKSKLNS
jgi:hypothetical protein